jgi:hypothetical protein
LHIGRYALKGRVLLVRYPLSVTPMSDYDKIHFPTERANFLKAWITQPESRALGVIENKQLKGYGVFVGEKMTIRLVLCLQIMPILH